MANIKSAQKRILTIAKRTERNKSRISAMKTAIKKVDTAVLAGDKETAVAHLPFAIKKISKVAAQGTIHQNKASRLVSKLTKRVNTL